MRTSHKLILAIFFSLVVFFIRDSVMLDPDFGWHIETGNYILKYGIPKTDPFSFTMPSYKFIEYEWLSDLIYAIFYPTLSMFGFSILQYLIIVSSLFLLIGKKFYKWTPAVVLFSTGELLMFPGVRPQIFTWIFFSIFLFILFDKKRRSKYIFLLPLLMIVWVNLHGGFAIGIFLLLLILITESYINKKIYIKGFIALLLSIFATFINPYGIRIWEVILNHAIGINLRLNILEWLPGITTFHPTLFILISISALIIYRYFKKFDKTEAILFIILLVASFSATKFIPFFVLISVIILNKGLLHLKNDLPDKIALKRFNTFLSILFYLGIFLFILQSYMILKFSYELSENSYYPKKAVEFLNNKHLGKNIFSTYNWGGYLIWKLPGRYFFVDGRMPTWNNFNVQNKKESSSAFTEYIDIITNKISFKDTAKKYNIDTVVLPIQTPPKEKGILYELKSFGNTLLKEKGKSAYSLEQQLIKAKFKQIYKDNISVVYSNN